VTLMSSVLEGDDDGPFVGSFLFCTD